MVTTRAQAGGGAASTRRSDTQQSHLRVFMVRAFVLRVFMLRIFMIISRILSGRLSGDSLDEEVHPTVLCPAVVPGQACRSCLAGAQDRDPLGRHALGHEEVPYGSGSTLSKDKVVVPASARIRSALERDEQGRVRPKPCGIGVEDLSVRRADGRAGEVEMHRRQ